MIQFDKDGVTLVGYDANGNRFAHNYLEGTLYDGMLNTRSAQLAAARENTQAVGNYNTVLGTIQASVDAGRPHDSAPTEAATESGERYGRCELRAVRAAAGRPGGAGHYGERVHRDSGGGQAGHHV